MRIVTKIFKTLCLTVVLTATVSPVVHGQGVISSPHKTQQTNTTNQHKKTTRNNSTNTSDTKRSKPSFLKIDGKTDFCEIESTAEEQQLSLSFETSLNIKNLQIVNTCTWLHPSIRDNKLQITVDRNTTSNTRSDDFYVMGGSHKVWISVIQKVSPYNRQQPDARDSKYETQKSHQSTSQNQTPINRSRSYNSYNHSRYTYHNTQHKPSASKIYPSKNFYIDLGAVSYFNPISVGTGGAVGFNIKGFNMQCDFYYGWDANPKPHASGNNMNTLSLDILLGWNFIKDKRCKLALQAGFGVSNGPVHPDGDKYYYKDAVIGGALGLRTDVVLCKHLSFHASPILTIGAGYNVKLLTGLSVYF